MATGGWSGITQQDLAPRPKPRRLGVNGRVLEAQARQLEAEVAAGVERLFGRLMGLGRILEWTHIRDMRRSRPGLPDYVVAVRPGLVLFIELKRPVGGVLSPEQQLWLLAAGGRGLLATSVEMVEWFLRGHGVECSLLPSRAPAASVVGCGEAGATEGPAEGGRKGGAAGGYGGGISVHERGGE